MRLYATLLLCVTMLAVQHYVCVVTLELGSSCIDCDCVVLFGSEATGSLLAVSARPMFPRLRAVSVPCRPQPLAHIGQLRFCHCCCACILLRRLCACMFDYCIILLPEKLTVVQQHELQAPLLLLAQQAVTSTTPKFVYVTAFCCTASFCMWVAAGHAICTRRLGTLPRSFVWEGC
jgi:hypothetical protein